MKEQVGEEKADVWTTQYYDAEAMRQDHEKWRNRTLDPPLITSNAAENKKNEEMFQLLAHYDNQNYVMTTASIGAGIETKGQMGLIEGHEYSILEVHRVRGVQDYFELIHLRNPWGDTYYTGPWSRGSEEWKKYPGVCAALRPRADPVGALWMDFKDYIRIFNVIHVSPKTVPFEKSVHMYAKEEVNLIYGHDFNVGERFLCADDVELVEDPGLEGKRVANLTKFTEVEVVAALDSTSELSFVKVSGPLTRVYCNEGHR